MVSPNFPWKGVVDRETEGLISKQEKLEKILKNTKQAQIGPVFALKMFYASVETIRSNIGQ